MFTNEKSLRWNIRPSVLRDHIVLASVRKDHRENRLVRIEALSAQRISNCPPE